MKRFRVLNGYILRYKPNHHKAIKSGGERGYVYEHVLVIEKKLGRKVKDNEEIHHLDFWRSNNSPNNLIALGNSAHQTIHEWVKRGAPIYGQNCIEDLPSKKKAIAKIPRCKVCKFPLFDNNTKTCSYKCNAIHREITNDEKRGKKKPTKAKLKKLLKDSSWLAVGKLYGVSDNCVRKWAIKLGMDPSKYGRHRRK